ncbi:transcriptional regulator, partial [Chloroflexota bacterium]
METRKFGARLRELREQAGLSQAQLAGMVGVNFTYLSKIESGVRPSPSEKVILRLAEVLDADRDELMTLAGKVPSDIAQMLKNRENLQSLRSGRTQNKSRPVNKKENFNTGLRELREQAGLSQRELADKVGINFTYLSKIESGVMPPPSEKVILRLAEVLDADRDELMTLAGKVPSDIAQMLKNRENLQFLRSGGTQKKVKAATETGGINIGGFNMMKSLGKYKKLSRVALAVVLVCAMAVSLWFTSPSPVRALEIAITNPQGDPLISGTLGQTYQFNLQVSIDDYELLPIEYVNLSIYNTANASGYTATINNLPVTDGGSANYTDEQTGGGSVNITAAAPAWNQVSGGYRYVMWAGYAYQFGEGYGYTGNITYSIVWTPPVGWPEDDYIIEAEITANSYTFTQLSSEFTLQQAGFVAETSISEALDQATGKIVVVNVNIDRIKDPVTGNTTAITSGIGSYSAIVSSAPGSGIEVLGVTGLAPFANLTFDNVTGIFSAA